jgi:Divergent InlB B-repeat domain
MSPTVGRCGAGSRGRGAVLLALLVPLVLALPAAGSETPARAAGTATIVIHGQGRVTSEPPGAIDCPGRCTLAFTGSTQLTLRAAAATGWEIEQLAFCVNVDVCTVALGDFTYNLDVYFRPRAELQLWPRGDGAIAVSPQPADDRGLPTAPTCNRENAFEGTGCRFYYLPGTRVTATASADPGSTFLGWSAQQCAGTVPCTVTMSRDDVSLVARFTPLEVRVIKGGLPTGAVVSEPPGISCPPTCTARFPAGTRVTLVAQPDPATPFVSWKFGCAVAASDPNRCVLVATNRPNWVGVALGEDDEIGVPTNLSVLFDVSREGQGDVVGRQLDCGGTCERKYGFGAEEELRARPAGGWRFTAWRGACAKQPICRLYVGPVTSVAARFTENLVPQLLSVAASGKKKGRKLTVRLSVTHAAQVRLQLRRVGKTKLLAERRRPLKGGANAVVLPVPAGVAAGKLRLTIAVSDGLGGGRTWNRQVKVGG